MKASNTQTQMRKGILEFCILHIISRGEVYATDLIEELKTAQMLIVEGTLYPVLNRLKNSNLASYKWVESDLGPPRKYYSITPEGLAFLNDLQKTWAALDTSVNQIITKAKKE
ncbi:PadR family transcriptional regulator [uncultured Cyclobacterium sp.]|uniref:PadR family transcriptional regulator n=1 Tax=uncultured Cyclobacterium sp. TaxID=453820 RepID=UPI0030EC251D|tara:strand:+ start:159960 stop:160298 length:339 start_codon:yes stop_codon:yes gene_type:complete